jgi:hypothetical protein
MIRVESAAIAPGRCAVTGKSDGPFVDTLIDLDDLPGYGRIYLGFDYVRTIAMDLCDMRPRAEIEAAEDKLALAEARIAELEGINGGLFHVKQVIDDAVEAQMSRMPTPTELRRDPAPEPDEVDVVDSPPAEHPDIEAITAALVESGQIDPPAADPADTPTGEAPDATPAVLFLAEQFGAEDAKVIAAFYGDVDSLDEMLEIDPVPEKVADIKAWVDDADHPVIKRVRAEMAVEVERRSSEPRTTVLALAEVDDDA